MWPIKFRIQTEHLAHKDVFIFCSRRLVNVILQLPEQEQVLWQSSQVVNLYIFGTAPGVCRKVWEHERGWTDILAHAQNCQSPNQQRPNSYYQITLKQFNPDKK